MTDNPASSDQPDAAASSSASPPVSPPAVGMPPQPPSSASPGAYPTFANGKPAVDEAGQPISSKSRLAAALLAWFIGVFGVHRFYVGKVGTGILMILTFGGLGVWVLVDLIMILVGSFRDKEGLRLYNW